MSFSKSTLPSLLAVIFIPLIYSVLQDWIQAKNTSIIDTTTVYQARGTQEPIRMADPAATDTSNISKLLSFWFDHDQGLEKWFKHSNSVDEECQQWRPLVEAARSDVLTQTWSLTPNGTLALLILLDQLPRNIYRGTPQAYASDDQAMTAALDAISQGLDRKVPLERQMFFYLPLMHQESLLAQVGTLGLYQGMLARADKGTDMHKLLEGALGMAQVHVDIIRRFGRFPGRNIALGRESTQEELVFLADKGPRGF